MSDGVSADDMRGATSASTFAATLIDWQRSHGRQTLPWQQLDGPRDAYRVWVAEIMLQQTQVAAVIPFYRRFLARFPDVTTLAAAPADDVMQAWGGLGYYSRARNLHAAAQEVVKRFDGAFPDDAATLQTLPGVGRSTAAAIAAFAFGERAAILDGNVKRVLARVFAIEGGTGQASFNKRAWPLAESLLPERDIERYTQGLMDLGATICTPRKPSCRICPFETTCSAHRERREDAYPERKARKAVPRRRATLIVALHRRAVLLERRPPRGIWGGLWSLPQLDDAPDDAPDAAARAAEALGATRTRHEAGFTHAFTHYVLEADLLRLELDDPPGIVAGEQSVRRWVPLNALEEIGLPTPIRTLLERL